MDSEVILGQDPAEADSWFACQKRLKVILAISLRRPAFTDPSCQGAQQIVDEFSGNAE
jgi:hypothetical protein